ncbi:hypothetical protein SDC9_86406 [bioreactor metagenome]|uniref:Uncharacterized protein n=1 Tax=bioreactor metagenome TaxID=1076179 RepID=A0A644ZIU8_9ZZZZ
MEGQGAGDADAGGPDHALSHADPFGDPASHRPDRRGGGIEDADEDSRRRRGVSPPGKVGGEEEECVGIGIDCEIDNQERQNKPVHSGGLLGAVMVRGGSGRVYCMLPGELVQSFPQSEANAGVSIAPDTMHPLPFDFAS